MATLPLILSLADDLDRMSSAASPSFYALEPSFMAPRYHHHHHGHWPAATPRWAHQLSQLGREERDSLGKVFKSPIGKDGFQVCMDVGQFKPSELNVKVVENSVIVEGKHEEREDDHGFITRHFVRRYALPKGYESEKVISTLSSDGVLTVSVPKPPAIADKATERVVQIQQVGPAHLNVKENAKEDAAKDKVAEEMK